MRRLCEKSFRFLKEPEMTFTYFCTYAIIQLVKRQFCADTQGLNGVTSMTQGSRSVSYSDAMTLSYTIDDSIKALLPKPYARLF